MRGMGNIAALTEIDDTSDYKTYFHFFATRSATPKAANILPFLTTPKQAIFSTRGLAINIYVGFHSRLPISISKHQ